MVEFGLAWASASNGRPNSDAAGRAVSASFPASRLVYRMWRLSFTTESTIDAALLRPVFCGPMSIPPAATSIALGAGPSTALGTSDTKVRRKVLAMTMALAAITYLDRVAIGVTRPYIAQDLDLTPTQMGYVFSAFYLSYALFEIPTGWWGDKVGTRKVLTRIVCWWSAFTVLTGFAFNYSSLLAVRFLFGAGEAGAWPNVARTFSRWRSEEHTSELQSPCNLVCRLVLEKITTRSN